SPAGHRNRQLRSDESHRGVQRADGDRDIQGPLSRHPEQFPHARRSAMADLRLEITRSFWAVITARASLEVVRQALERTNAHLNDLRNQLSVGLVPPS